MLSLKSSMEQQQVSHALISDEYIVCVGLNLPLSAFFHFSCYFTDPADYSSAGRYRVDFCLTAFSDTDTPAPFADSLPITINIMDDTIFEGLEYFQARIVETSDLIRVRIGQQDTVNVTIIDDESESFISLDYSQTDYLSV